jgi:hypothetical protein
MVQQHGQLSVEVLCCIVLHCVVLCCVVLCCVVLCCVVLCCVVLCCVALHCIIFCHLSMTDCNGINRGQGSEVDPMWSDAM